MSVLCVPLYAQIEGESSLSLVGQMVSLKFIIMVSHTLEEQGWMVPLDSLAASHLFLCVLVFINQDLLV